MEEIKVTGLLRDIARIQKAFWFQRPSSHPLHLTVSLLGTKLPF
jgi:hypothetical protein